MDRFSKGVYVLIRSSSGALDRLQNFKIPDGLTRETLMTYQRIAQDVIAKGLDKTGCRLSDYGLLTVRSVSCRINVAYTPIHG